MLSHYQQNLINYFNLNVDRFISYIIFDKTQNTNLNLFIEIQNFLNTELNKDLKYYSHVEHKYDDTLDLIIEIFIMKDDSILYKELIKILNYGLEQNYIHIWLENIIRYIILC